MDHDKMRRASELLSGRTPAPDTPSRSREHDPGDVSAARLEPIPGEVDNTTAMSSQPGIVGTTGYGVDAPATDDTTLDEALVNEARWSGGGQSGGGVTPTREKNDKK